MRMWSDVTPAGSGADLSAEAGAGSSSDAGSRVGVTVLPAELILAPDSSFLRADDTSFPVVIDPMLAKSTSYTNWLMVWSDGQKFWNNSSEHARAGFDGWEGDKVARSMYAMDTRFLDGKIVGKATFQHRQIHSPPSHCEPTSPSVPMGIYRVGGINSGQSWSNQPNWYERYATSNVQHGTDRLCPGYTNTEWNVTNGAKQAADNGWDALTLGLRSTDEETDGVAPVRQRSGQGAGVDRGVQHRTEYPFHAVAGEWKEVV